jgi:hypothetical protein
MATFLKIQLLLYVLVVNGEARHSKTQMIFVNIWTEFAQNDNQRTTNSLG